MYDRWTMIHVGGRLCTNRVSSVIRIFEKKKMLKFDFNKNWTKKKTVNTGAVFRCSALVSAYKNQPDESDSVIRHETKQQLRFWVLNLEPQPPTLNPKP